MEPLRHETAAIAELVDRFIEIGVAQDNALLYDETGKFNRLYWQKKRILDELKRRPDDQRSALIPLYDHPNMQVRTNAATATLALAPIAARRTLEAIALRKDIPQCLDAGMSLWNLDRGVFKPT